MTATTADAPVSGPDEDLKDESVEGSGDEPRDEPEKPDVDVIVPVPAKREVGGMEITVKHLRAREFFKLTGIVTNGLGPALSQVDFRGLSSDELQGTFASMLLMAIPNAIEEFLGLARDIVAPVEDDQRGELARYMKDPEIDDLLPIIDGIVENEAENLAALVGKARGYFAKWQETFQKTKFR